MVTAEDFITTPAASFVERLSSGIGMSRRECKPDRPGPASEIRSRVEQPPSYSAAPRRWVTERKAGI